MLEEKLDLLTKEIVALRKAVEENTAAGGATSGGGSAAAEDKPAGKKRGRPPKEEAPEPTHGADEVEEIVRRVSREVGKPAAVKIIKSFKCDDLADLLSHPEHFDAAYDAAEAALPAEGGEDDEEDI
jgi:hypothetical protein